MDGNSISKTVIFEKAKHLHQDLLKKTPGTSSESDVFMACRGWFEKFQKRSGMHSVVCHGEAAHANRKDEEEFGAYVSTRVLSLNKCLIVMKLNCFGRKCPKEHT